MYFFFFNYIFTKGGKQRRARLGEGEVRETEREREPQRNRKATSLQSEVSQLWSISLILM